MKTKILVNAEGIIDKKYLFTPGYVPIEISFQKMPDSHVSDAITENEIEKWKGSTRCPVFISAQTGKGKNYFVTHNLREYAKKNGERILYISNRVALDYQQKKELSTLTNTKFKPTISEESIENVEAFSNVTVVTYHKLLQYFSQKSPEWFSSFRYVVIDECHFFYSDSLFNPNTGFLLKKIVKEFRNSVRIYMSATFDDVLDPICYYESNFITIISSGNRSYACSPFAYYFPRNFSQYQCNYFSDLKQIEAEILKSRKTEKWIVFVTSKEAGKTLCNTLNCSLKSTSKQSEKAAVYFDSQSRNSDDIETRVLWEQLKRDGKISNRILITTSVLDNGFSIKDTRVKNIVICTDDKTEFLQELGRCRIDKESELNLYIQKVSPKAYADHKRICNSFLNLFENFCGEPQEAFPKNSNAFLNSGNPAQVVKELWTTWEDFRRGPINLIVNEDRTLSPVINKLAWWHTLQVGRQLEAFKQLQEQEGDRAGIIFKAQWLCCDSSPKVLDVKELLERDLDRLDSNTKLKELLEFLDKQAEKNLELIEGSNDFEEFSMRFTELYKKAFPKDNSINRGRKKLGHDFIQTHLEKISEYTGEGDSCYEGTPRQATEVPKKAYRFCVNCQQSKVRSGGICRESEGTDSGLSHSVIRGLVTDRLMTTP